MQYVRRAVLLLVALFLFSLLACTGMPGERLQRSLEESGYVALEQNTVEFILQNQSYERGVFTIYGKNGHRLKRYRVPGFTADTVTFDPGSYKKIIVGLRHFGQRGREHLIRPPVMLGTNNAFTVSLMSDLDLSGIGVFIPDTEYWLARDDHPDSMLFDGLRPVAIPEEWVQWWNEAETCLGMDDNPRDYDWWVANQMVGPAKGGTYTLYGAYDGGHDHIYIRHDRIQSESTIKHEAIHAILVENGVGKVGELEHGMHEDRIAACAPKLEQ